MVNVKNIAGTEFAIKKNLKIIANAINIVRIVLRMFVYNAFMVII